MADVLRRWRKSAGFTLAVAAAQIGTTTATLSRIERGENADGRTLAKILKWLMEETK